MLESVLKLRQSPAGRRFLDKQRRIYEKDIIQPHDPRFEKIYGAQIKKRERDSERQASLSKQAWEEKRALADFRKSGKKYF